MISTVTLTFDLTYTNPATGALQPRGIVTDLTDYSGLGVNLLLREAKGLGVITFNGDIIVNLNTVGTPMIDLQNWDYSNGVPTYTFNLPLDLNGNVANGVYTFTYSLRLYLTGEQFTSVTPPDTIITDGDLYLADFLEVGNTIILEGGVNEPVVVSSAVVDDPNVEITTSTVISGALFDSFGFDITNVQLNEVYSYAGCTQASADVNFVYDCEVGNSGSWAVANTTTLAANESITSLNCTVSYPSWTALTPTFNPQVVLTSLPYPSAPGTETPLATGTYTVSLTEQIEQTQTDGLILSYSRSVIKEFTVSCAGTLCGLVPCIENLRVAHQTELIRNKVSKYQVYVDNVLMYYIEALNYKACGEVAKYKETIALLEAQLDASGCECACCDDETYYWVSNNSGVSVIESLIQSFQFRLYDGIPGVTEDVTQGVQEGAIWEDVNTGILYRCTDNTEGAAVWEEYYAPGVSPDAIDVPADNTGHNFLTAANVQLQLDQVDALAIFDGFNGIFKDGNNLGLGGTLTETTVIDCQNVLELEGGGLVMDVTAKPGVAARFIVEDPATNTVSSNIYLQRTRPNGDPGADGIGTSIWFMANDAIGGNPVKTSAITSTWVNATIGSSNLQISTKLGGAENVGITLNANSSLTLNEYGSGTFSSIPDYVLGVTNTGLVTEINAALYQMAVIRISQTGASAPTLVQSVYNNTGQTFSFNYASTGIYRATLGGLITVNKTSAIITNGLIGSVIGFVCVEPTAAGYVFIRTYDATGTLADGILNNATLELKFF